ncbi:hypothetical protein DENSPDRAFT_702676 [Dentipellis sp. KUC8613]|nr:hypothetical protein DENSPDRAFT_702676 [Dentipellis sp. KUC8613]
MQAPSDPSCQHDPASAHSAPHSRPPSSIDGPLCDPSNRICATADGRDTLFCAAGRLPATSRPSHASSHSEDACTASHPQGVAAPSFGEDALSNSSAFQNSSQLSASRSGSSYDPALNEAYLQFFNNDGGDVPLPEDQPREGSAQHVPTGASTPMAPPSRPASLRRPSRSASRSRPSSSASSMVSLRPASKANAAPSITSPVHATPTFSPPTQKFGDMSSSSTSGALWDPASAFIAPSSTSSDAPGIVRTSSLPRPIPATPRVDGPRGLYHGNLAGNHQLPFHSAGTALQPPSSHFQLPPPSPAMVNFPAFRGSSPVAAVPMPGYSDNIRSQTPYHATADSWSSYPQQSADASSVFRFSVDDVAPPAMASADATPAQGAILPDNQNQDRSQSATNAEPPYQGMPPPPVEAALSYSPFGSFPQTGLSIPAGGSLHIRNRVPQYQPVAFTVRPDSLTPQSSQVAANTTASLPGLSQLPSRTPSRQIAGTSAVFQVPAAHPKLEKRKASASPPSDATQARAPIKRASKRTNTSKDEAAEPSAVPEDPIQEAPSLPVESPANAHVRRLRDARRARRFRDLYAEVVTELSSPRTDRNPSDDDVLRLAKIAVQGLKEEIRDLKQTEQRIQSQLLVSQQELAEKKRWGEDTYHDLQITRHRLGQAEGKIERLSAENGGLMIELQGKSDELGRTIAQWKISVEEKRQIEDQAQQRSDRIDQLTHERQELYDDLQSMKAELQRVHGHRP